MNKRIIIIAALGAVLFSACGHDASHSHEDAEEHEEVASDGSPAHSHDNPDVIEFAAAKAKAAGVETAVVKPGDFHAVTMVGGKVMPASGDETTLVATVAGVVSLNRTITEGMALGAGAPVFTIASAALQDGDISARTTIAYETAKAEYERAQKLVADKIISEKEFLAVKATYESAALAYKAVGQGSAAAKGITVKTAAAGYVKECLVKEGDYVAVGQPLMVVTKNRSLYLRAEVAERDYAILNQITTAKFKMAYSDRVYDLKELKGRLVSYGKAQGVTSSFIPVTFEFANCSGIIPGAFAEVYLITGTRANVLTVPVTALTEEQGVYFVYVRDDADCYHKQEVRLGLTDGERIEVLSGLHGGETVVVRGAVQVKLASASTAIPGHTHNH